MRVPTVLLLHTVCHLPEGDANFPVRWRKLKARSTRAVGGEWRRSPSKVAKGERGALAAALLGAHDPRRRRLAAACGILLAQSGEHGLVGAVRDWPPSSFYRDVRRGLVPEDWAGDGGEGRFGE